MKRIDLESVILSLTKTCDSNYHCADRGVAAGGGGPAPRLLEPWIPYPCPLRLAAKREGGKGIKPHTQKPNKGVV